MSRSFYEESTHDMHERLPRHAGQMTFGILEDIQHRAVKVVHEKVVRLGPNHSAFAQTYHTRATNHVSEQVRQRLHRMLHVKDLADLADQWAFLGQIGCPTVFASDILPSFCNPNKEILQLTMHQSSLSDHPAMTLLFKFFDVDLSLDQLWRFHLKLHRSAPSLVHIKSSHRATNRLVRDRWTPLMRMYFDTLTQRPLDEINVESVSFHNHVFRCMSRHVQLAGQYLAWNYMFRMAHLYPMLHGVINEMYGVPRPLSWSLHKLDWAMNAWPVAAGNLYASTLLPEQWEFGVKFVKLIRTSLMQWISANTSLTSRGKKAVMKKIASIRVIWARPTSAKEPPVHEELGYADLVCRGFEQQWNERLRRLGGPVRRGMWRFMNKFESNACYSRELNTVYMPATMLMEPLFSPDHWEVTLNGLGFIVAHELAHAIDSEGSKIGFDGTFDEEWTEEDRLVWDRLHRQVLHLYRTHGSNPKMEVTGENIADILATFVTYEIFLRTNPTTAQKKHFLQVLAKMRFSEFAVDLSPGELHEDEHAASADRTNVPVALIPEFASLFPGRKPLKIRF